MAVSEIKGTMDWLSERDNSIGDGINAEYLCERGQLCRVGQLLVQRFRVKEV